ncbi:hypothetical protein [Nitrobacter sp.]|uniref:hypothetical protein n=1 Tax=Nitrobacter sp. TaxID=29420 RepID=UPI0029CAC495|nr:hypothetical protein [Nitrobacter sp.]
MGIAITGFTTEADLSREIGEWIQAQTIAFAEEKFVEHVAQGFSADAEVITDGVTRRSYLQVKPYGKIEFARRANMAEAVLFALERLREISPVGPPKDGHYKDDHIVLLNGSQITGDLRSALMDVAPTDRVQIVNPRIYARKLEGSTASRRTGRVRRRGSSRQAPNGIYRVVQRQVLQRFGRVLFVDFKMVKLNTGAKVWGAVGGGRTKINGKWTTRPPRGRALRDQVYPALQFFIQSNPAVA